MTKQEMYNIIDEAALKSNLNIFDFAENEQFCINECPFKEYCSKNPDFVYGCEIWEISMGEDL